MMARALRKEIGRFLIVGGIAVLIDAIVYFLLTRFQWMDPAWSKRTSFFAGSIWAYFTNKFFTFGKKDFSASEPVLFAIVYLTGFALNSVIHDVTLEMFKVAALAFLVATGVSTCTNFIGQKWIVFRVKSGERL